MTTAAKSSTKKPAPQRKKAAAKQAEMPSDVSSDVGWFDTFATIITFLLVALLQNTQERSDRALQDKLNAIAESMSHVMTAQGLEKEAQELRDAVGLEDRESSDGT
jgi:hypothetical protein